MGNDNVIGEGAAVEWKLFAAFSQWLASVWVVVEGWRQLAIKDSTIDGLLDEWPHYCELLRRYRNGVFHYQPELLDERFTAYATEGSDFVMWVFALYLEFQRFLWEWPDRFKGQKADIDEIRKTLEEIIGWMPEDIIPAKNRSLQDMCREAKEMVKASGDAEGEASKDLLSCVEGIQDGLRDFSLTPMLDYVRNMKHKKVNE